MRCRTGQHPHGSFLLFLALNFFLKRGWFPPPPHPPPKKCKRSVAKGGNGSCSCEILFGDVAYPVNISIILLKHVQQQSELCRISHHVMYLNVGCVRVCVTEAGRDLFMHNKSIWLIIEDVWNFICSRGGRIWSLTGKYFIVHWNVNGCSPAGKTERCFKV